MTEYELTLSLDNKTVTVRVEAESEEQARLFALQGKGRAIRSTETKTTYYDENGKPLP